MSEKYEEVATAIIMRKHNFFCDDCGKFLLSSTEYDDGYYMKPKEFYIQHVKLKGFYCEECGTKRCNDVIAYARSKNFDI
jgi:hypothetical protein